MSIKKIEAVGVLHVESGVSMERICGSEWLLSVRGTKQRIVFLDDHIPILFELFSEVMKLRESKE